jgi:formylglycine-generating enzyme required for sulfatase activity
MSKTDISEFKSSAGAVMIRVPAGCFTMGSPPSEDGHRAWEQEREVTFASDFYLGKTPITQDQFAAVTGTSPTVHEKIGDAPVDSVS